MQLVLSCIQPLVQVLFMFISELQIISRWLLAKFLKHVLHEIFRLLILNKKRFESTDKRKIGREKEKNKVLFWVSLLYKTP